MKNILTKKFTFVLLSAALAAGCSSSNSNNQSNNANANANAKAAATPAASQKTSAASEQAAPDAVVADLYKQHDAGTGPFFQSKDRALVDKYFTKRTADLIWKDATRKDQDEVGVFDGDPLYLSQDTDIKNFKVGTPLIREGSAMVPVTFEDRGEKETFRIALVLEKGSWKVADIDYGRDRNPLVRWLEEGLAGDEKAAAPDSKANSAANPPAKSNP